MNESVMVDSDVAFNTGQAVMTQAVELREELDRLGQEWDDLSQGWAGGAAAAFGAAWQDWHEGALTLVESLLDISEKLCRGAVLYEQQDAAGAKAAHAAGEQIPS
jgi:WXG100 family type VII secretion target